MNSSNACDHSQTCKLSPECAPLDSKIVAIGLEVAFEHDHDGFGRMFFAAQNKYEWDAG